MSSDLERLKVNSPDWAPNAYLLARRRWFKRPDGTIWALPETEDWHIQRVLSAGFVEVSGPNPEPPAPDPRDAEIAALKAALAAKESGHASTPADGADSGQGTGADRRRR